MDGLLKALDTTPKVEKKVETTNTEAYEYYLKGRYKWENAKNNLDIESAIELLNSAISIDSLLIIARNQLGWIYQQNGDLDNSFQIYKDAFKYAKKINDFSGIALSLKNIAWVYLNRNELDEAFKYFKQSYNISKKLGDKSQVAYSHNRFGKIYSSKGNYNKSIDHYNKSLPIFVKIQDANGLFWTKHLLGIAYYDKGSYRTAINYFNESLIHVKEIGFNIGVANNHNILGLVYFQTKQYKEALQHLDKAYKIRKMIGASKRSLLYTSILLVLINKCLKYKYDVENIRTLIKEIKDIEFEFNYLLFQLLEDTTYLKTAYNQIQTMADNLESDVKAKFLSYPIPKAIVEEWEKVK